jgi:hypothetical protein
MSIARDESGAGQGKGGAVAGKILKRCSICKRYGACYLLVDAQLGEVRLCHACWNDRQRAQTNPEGAGEKQAQAPKTNPERDDRPNLGRLHGYSYGGTGTGSSERGERASSRD